MTNFQNGSGGAHDGSDGGHDCRRGWRAHDSGNGGGGRMWRVMQRGWQCDGYVGGKVWWPHGW